MKDLPEDRNMIAGTTAMGAVIGSLWQGIVLGAIYHYVFRGEINEGSLGKIAALSIIPVASNIISGIHEWKHKREDPNSERLHELERMIDDSAR